MGATMVSWQACFRLLLCISLTLWGVEAGAQDGGLRDMQQRFQDKLDAQQIDIDSIKTTQEAILELSKQILARQSARDAVDMYVAQPDQLEKLLPGKQDAVEKGLKLVSDLPENSVPDKAKLEACIKAVVAVGKARTQDGGASAVAACPREDAQKLADDLAKQRDDATKTWTSCMNTFKRAKEFQDIKLPANPTGLSPEQVKETEEAIDAVRKQAAKTAGPAKDCVDGIEETFDKIQNAESAASALSAALSMAGSVCMMSGGNPYVCGAIFVVAMLMSLFDNKGGGNGDKTGDSSEDVGSKSAKVPKCTKDCGEKKPGGGGAPPIIGLGGDVQCAPASATAVDCYLQAAPQNKVRLDPANKVVMKSSPAENALQTKIATKDFTGISFCQGSDPTHWIKGLFVSSSAGKAYEVGLDYNSTEPGLIFNDNEITAPTDAGMSAACGMAFP
jgi:hypothetical protein